MDSPSTVSSEAAEAQLSQAFLDAEWNLMKLAQDGRPSLDSFAHDFLHLITQTKLAVDRKLISDTGKQHIHAVSNNIRSIAACFQHIDNSARHAEERLMSQYRTILQELSNKTTSDVPPSAERQKKATSQPGGDSALAEATKFKPCCDYFLAHFGVPYPSNDIKSALAAEIGVGVPSITMWFTNNRRRSGWNNVMRDHANNNKEIMRQLVDDVLNPSEARPALEDARQAVLDARAFIVRLSGDEVSGVFREALAMEPMTPEELKAYTEERRMLQKRLADLKRTQEEREAHKARKAARAKAREQKAARRAALAASNTSIAAPSPSSKRKRTDENEVAEMEHHDRPVKKSNTGTNGASYASVVAPTPARPKRKRTESGSADADAAAPSNRRSAKRARTSDAPRERKPRLRYVLDANGNPRRLRRKAQFRYRMSSSSFTLIFCPFVLTCFCKGPASPTTETQNLVCENDIQVGMQRSIPPLVVKKRKHGPDTNCAPSFSNAPSPRLPTNHKRRRTAPEPFSRSASSPHKSKSPQPPCKSRKKQSHGRSASAPTTSRREVPFLIPNVNNAMREANRTASGPSALVGLGAYVEGDAMLPPLTEEQLAMFVPFSTSGSSAPESAASGLAANVDQITIDLDPNTFNTVSLPFNLNSFNLNPTAPLSNSSSFPADPNGEGIDAFLQMMIPQNQLEIPMTGVDSAFLDPSQLKAQLSQLEAEQAAQQQSLNVPLVSQPQSAPFLPSPTPVCNPATPQIPGSFENVLMNALIVPPQPLQQQVLAPEATFLAAASNSLSASSFSSNFSGISSFGVPSPAEEYADPDSLSDSRARSLSPAGSSRVSSADLYAEVERRKRDIEDHLREYERKKAELGSIVTACAHSVIESSDLIA